MIMFGGKMGGGKWRGDGGWGKEGRGRGRRGVESGKGMEVLPLGHALEEGVIASHPGLDLLNRPIR